MPALASSALSPSQLIVVVRENLDYDQLGLDASVALAMAQMCRSALRQLGLIRPAEATAGGTGKGAGYSAVWDVAWAKEELAKVEGFIKLRGGSDILEHFGYRGADTRFLQDPPYAVVGRDC